MNLGHREGCPIEDRIGGSSTRPKNGTTSPRDLKYQPSLVVRQRCLIGHFADGIGRRTKEHSHGMASALSFVRRRLDRMASRAGMRAGSERDCSAGLESSFDLPIRMSPVCEKAGNSARDADVVMG